MSNAALIPIAVALAIVWHEWRQRKAPWPAASERSEESSPRQVSVTDPGTNK